LQAPPTSEIYNLSLHDALPIYKGLATFTPTSALAETLSDIEELVTREIGTQYHTEITTIDALNSMQRIMHRIASAYIRVYIQYRSEEHTSELQSRENLVCRLLL